MIFSYLQFGEIKAIAYSDNISRLSRITSILLKLQARTHISAIELAEQFDVSKRTIYRDLDSLQQAGIPIISIEGKGYSIMEGYHIPPVMFTESEANAIIFGEKLIAKTKDQSLIEEFTKAIDKIKSVLKNPDKEKMDFLAKRTIIGKNWDNERTSNFLSDIQKALTNFYLLEIKYKKGEASEISSRQIEPFAIYHNTEENWTLIAWCRMRKDFRNFRIDRIQELKTMSTKFEPHQLSMEEFVKMQQEKNSKRQ